MRAWQQTSSHKQAISRPQDDEKTSLRESKNTIADKRDTAGIADTGNREGIRAC
jgi:hypothetical protein